MQEGIMARESPVPAANVRLKRAYDKPARDDGKRILIDRLWPRGVRKADAQLDEWAKEIAPSTALRKWFGHDPARWTEFQVRYHAELADPGRSRTLDQLAERARRAPVTLVFGAHDPEHNQARVIADEIERRLTGASS
jgi:uncharacterized protein YeaO (DUF488 family)